MTTRIQRKRTKGWKKPEGAIYIGYGTKWGNPFKWKDLGSREIAVRKFKEWLPDAIRRGEFEIESLRDRTIMCFCSVGDSCHGDVIIEHLSKVDKNSSTDV